MTPPLLPSLSLARLNANYKAAKRPEGGEPHTSRQVFPPPAGGKKTTDYNTLNFLRGEAHSNADDKDQAIRWFDEALKRRPGFLPAVKEMAVVLLAAGRLPQAAELLEKAAAQNPSDTILLTDLGNVYLQQGNLDRAAQVLDQALRLDADLPDAQNLLGLARLRQETEPRRKKLSGSHPSSTRSRDRAQ